MISSYCTATVHFCGGLIIHHLTTTKHKYQPPSIFRSATILGWCYLNCYAGCKVKPLGANSEVGDEPWSVKPNGHRLLFVKQRNILSNFQDRNHIFGVCHVPFQASIRQRRSSSFFKSEAVDLKKQFMPAMIYESLYAVLQVDQTATLNEIKVAFKRQALQVHPDKGGSKEAFHLVYQALETLADPAARKKYDRTLIAPQQTKRCKATKPSSHVPRRARHAASGSTTKEAG